MPAFSTHPLLSCRSSAGPRKLRYKAANSVKIDLGTEFLCKICREVDLENLLTRPHLNERDFLSFARTPQEFLESASWNLTEIRKSSHCLLCQFLLLAVSVHEKPDLNGDRVIVAWPQPIAEYQQHPSIPIDLWTVVLGPLARVSRKLNFSRSTSTQDVLTRIPKTIGWQLHIATELSAEVDTNGTCALNEQVRDVQVGRNNRVSFNDCESRQVQKSYPSQLRRFSGYEVHNSLRRSEGLSYPTCARDMFHIRSGLSRFFAVHPANAEISSTCIQLRGRECTGVLERVSSAYETANMMKGRGLDTNCANLALARHWQMVCSCFHSPYCEPLKWSGQQSAPFKLRVIDVSKECVVEAPPKCIYVALSYCWGGNRTVCARQGQEFTQRKALSAKYLEQLSLRMPKTISDAMLVCKALGIRYLWVDRLCIVQDGANKQAQLDHMGYIFGGAQCTIVAGYGHDADAGLPGVSDVSRSRRHFHTQIQNLKLCTAPRNAAIVLLESPWYTRGWTFQELIFSKRILAFTEEQMLFFCVRGAFREDLMLEPTNGAITDVQSLGSFLESHIPLTGRTFNLKEVRENDSFCQKAMQTFGQFLSRYLCREFTHDTDILDAFSGILGALLPYLGPFRWGLPIYHSGHIIFAWRSADQFPLQRRVGFPSWSWTGWKGHTRQLDFGMYIDISDTFKYPSEPYFYGRKPQIFVFTDEGQLIPIEYATCLHDPTSIPELSTTTSEPPVIDSSIMEVLREKSIDQLIVLYASCVFLPVDRQPSEPTKDCYAIQLDLGNICLISLDPHWRNQQGDILEFMLVEGYRFFFRLVLIVRDGPVAYRIQVAQKDVSDLYLRKGKRELMIMG